MSEKKRKRSEKAVETPRKKSTASETSTASALANAPIKINHHARLQQCGPILASTPGFTLPNNTEFAPFQSQTELLLHASSHPRLSYTARDNAVATTQDELSHYLAVFIPQTGSLELISTRHLTIRSALKSEDEEVRRDSLRQSAATNLSARQQLGLEFGNKKAKKAIESLSQNAISPANSQRMLATDVEGREAARKLLSQDVATNAIIEGISVAAVGAGTREERQGLADGAQPRPQPNLNATDVREVYPLQVLVGTSMLNSIHVKDWIDMVSAGKSVDTHSRFVSERLTTLGNEEEIERLKVLKYMLILIEFHSTMRRAGKDMARKLPKPDVLKEKLRPVASDALIDRVKKRFSKAGEVTKWQLDNLYAHIVAMSLFVDDFETEFSSLAQDLSLTSSTITPYYRSIGAKVGPPTEAQRLRLEKTQAEAKGLKIAKLKLPLDFPKQRQIPVQNRGRGRR